MAARSNDSRELQESLEGMLELVEQYASRAPTDRQLLTVLPEAYTRHGDRLHNPLELHPGMNSRAAHPTDNSDRPWFADEVGRAVLRATELALQSQTLPDRDTSRLLNTLTNTAQLFHRQAKCCPTLERSTVITLHYLTEIGLGARHCPPDRLDWYLEPCVRLACLHNEYSKDRCASQLSTVSAAGVLLIAEALVAAKERTSNTATTEVVAMISRAVSPSPVLHPAGCHQAVADARSGRLEPRERAATYQCDEQRLEALAEALSCPPGPNPNHA